MMLLVLAVSGCNNSSTNTGSGSSETKATKAPQVAYQASEKEDTTEQSLTLIEKKAPLFKKYIEKQMHIPYTLVSEISDSSGKTTSGIYIKDESEMVVTTLKPDGAETRVIYAGDKAYQIETDTKTIYEYDCGEDSVKDSIRRSLMTIDFGEASKTKFVCDTATYEGTEYNRETLKNGDVNVEYYFDKATDDLVYIVQSNSVTKILRFVSEFTNDELFNLPDGYERKSFDELQEKYREERKAWESSYEASLAAEAQPQEAAE